MVTSSVTTNAADSSPSTSVVTTSPKGGKRKKINIAPGKSVSEADVLQLEAEVETKKQRVPRGNTSKHKCKNIPDPVQNSDSEEVDNPEEREKLVLPKRGRPRKCTTHTATDRKMSVSEISEASNLGPSQNKDESLNPQAEEEMPVSMEKVSCSLNFGENWLKTVILTYAVFVSVHTWEVYCRAI